MKSCHCPGVAKKANTRYMSQCPICFCLAIDDFVVKYLNQEDADHLINAIRKYYPMTVDKEATKYIGLTIEWDYENRKAHFHMPGSETQNQLLVTICY
jgi:hypothetical protein